MQFIGRSALEAMEGLDWEVLAGLAQGQVVPEKPLRDYQLEALAAAKAHYAAGHHALAAAAVNAEHTTFFMQLVKH